MRLNGACSMQCPETKCIQIYGQKQRDEILYIQHENVRTGSVWHTAGTGCTSPTHTTLKRRIILKQSNYEFFNNGSAPCTPLPLGTARNAVATTNQQPLELSSFSTLPTAFCHIRADSSLTYASSVCKSKRKVRPATEHEGPEGG
jgi:hypothetical protein